MYAEERHEAIVERARQAGRVDVAGLAEFFDVTPETIRRDLTALERAGRVRRVHGGAILVEQTGFEPALASRDSTHISEKERIAKAALTELPVEGAILLDAGSTTARLAELLPSDRELTVVTNALPIAATLASRSNITVLLLGGRVRGRTMATVGSWAARQLADTYVDVAFMGTNGLSVERGLTTPDITEAEVKQALMKAARRTVVLADHTKVGVDHLARFGGLDDIDLLITDAGLDAELALDLDNAGLRVVQA